MIYRVKREATRDPNENSCPRTKLGNQGLALSSLRHRWRYVPDTWVTLSAFVLREVWMPWKASS
ncbi:hypothetical protein, partial [Bradyrhizobium sp. UFLA05-112]